MSILNKKSEKLPLIRHSTAHVMAEAVKNLFEGTRVAIGPAIDTGFYYDFELPRPIKDEDLPKIEKEMRRILATNAPFVKSVISRKEALELFRDQPFKIELINGLAEDAEISTYTSDKFVDLCRGPHVESMKEINPQAFKLMKIAGAYWRGDEKRPMLTRIYGTAWENPNDLKEYLQLLEEAEKRDHRKLGVVLDFFHLDEEDPGQVFWHPKGWEIYLTIQQYVRKCLKEDGYLEVNTPFVMPRSLWERSGHWAKYQENMFITESEKRTFALKPMNCPGHVEIFKRGLKSYRDLPLRLAEFGSCTRNEPSGSLHGIMRVRGFVQDDAHIFMLESQIKDELIGVIHLIDEIYKPFGFNYKVELSTKPEKAMGSDELWEKATSGLMQALEEVGMPYTLNPGDGAFYGPKIDYHLEDSLGRTWQCGTIQLDFQMPEKFDMTYIGEDGEKHRPVMVHRAILGSMERFIGILTEHFAGAFPIWLSPVQTIVLPITDDQADYAKEVVQKLKKAGVRAEGDYRNEKIGYKIREAQMQKIPYMLVVGRKEIESQTVSVRDRKEGDIGIKTIDEITAQIVEEIQTKIVK